MFKLVAPVLVALAIVISGFGATSASASGNPSPVVTPQTHELQINCAYDNATYNYLKAYGLLPLPQNRFEDASWFQLGTPPLPFGFTYFASAELGASCPANAYSVYVRPADSGPY